MGKQMKKLRHQHKNPKCEGLKHIHFNCVGLLVLVHNVIYAAIRPWKNTAGLMPQESDHIVLDVSHGLYRTISPGCSRIFDKSPVLGKCVDYKGDLEAAA